MGHLFLLHPPCFSPRSDEDSSPITELTEMVNSNAIMEDFLFMMVVMMAVVDIDESGQE